MEKQCTRCGIVQPVAQFSKNVTHTDGNMGYCKGCAAKKRKLYYEANKELFAERHRLYTYGLTKKQHDAILKTQNGVCAICKRAPDTSTKGRFAVDHSHTTGHIRGLLCGQCNAALGSFQDNVIFLQAAINYINYHAANTEAPIKTKTSKINADDLLAKSNESYEQWLRNPKTRYQRWHATRQPEQQTPKPEPPREMQARRRRPPQ